MKLYNTRMGLIDIKNISGDIRFSTDFNVGSIGRYSLGKEDYITLPFNVLTPINFKMGDYVDLSGILDESLGGKFAKIYEVVDLPTPTYDQSTGGYNYELRLDAYYWKWKNKKFKYMPEVAGQEASWNLTASLDMQLGVFLRNLQALGYKYRGNDFDFSIDSSVEDSAKLMSYENTNLLDALTNMAETWNCEWWVEDNIIRFGRCENGDAVRIELGVEAQEMPRSESQGTYATRVYAFGSTRNIPSNYRPVDETVVVNGIVQKRLMLPEGTPYIDAYRYKDGKRVYIGEEGYDIGTEMPQEEAIEDIIFLDEVYPRTECVVGTVGSYTSTIEDEETQETVTQTFYYVTDTSGLVFDKSYIIDGEELRLVFQSGLLNGMDFGVTFHKAGTSLGSVTLESDVYEIVANDNYGRTLPDETLKPTTGDKFILYGWDSTKITDLGLVSNAEQELRDKTVDCVKKMMVDDGTYNTTLASSWVKENMISRTFDIGQRIELVNKSFFETSRISRVIGLEIKLDLPYDAPVYTIGESTAYSRIGELENKVDNLTYKGQTYTSGGRKGVYIIRTNDSTAPSNSNVFSALRSLAMFLRKDIADTANELITFLKGIVVKSYLKIGEFITGVSGGYIDEKGNLEMESGVFRKRLFVPEIAYNRTTYFKGRMVNSPGGGCSVLSYVDNGDGTYTITPDLTDADGLSQFVDDILTTYFVTKNSEGKLNGFEEMKFRVTAADYTAKKFTVIPRPGHSDWKPAEQMVLAQTGNFTDPERQTYILIDSVNGNNCITFFDNANTWDPEPAQMPAWFGKKKGMTVNGIDCEKYSAVLQQVLLTGLIFQIDEITGNKVRVPLDKGEWVAGKYAYYDRVSHNGALWLCVDDNGTTTEPSEGNPAWLKQVAEGADGATGPQGVPGTPGKDGVTYYTWIRYADNAQGGGISNNPTGKAYIGFAYNKTSAVESNTPSDYTWSEIKGEQGVPGAPGADGKTYYTWIAYSDNADGTGMYQQPKDTTKYIGIAVNKETATESSNPSDYTWSLFKGKDGADGLSVIGGGHWESAKTPYKANTMVTLANCVFLSKVETSNPPIRILRVKGGNFLRKKDGGYYLAGKPADWEVNEDWDMLLDGRELKGESITFLGEFATAPANPKNGDSYRNTTDRATYIYQDGRWQLMISDGKDGKGYEYIYTRGNIIDNTPEKPDSQQKDGYVPEGWTDNYLGTDIDHQVEWGCTRFKENGVWSEFSDPAVVHRWSKDGADGESITAAGHWESANIPYAKNSTVSFAGGSYLSKVQTSNPPLPLLRVRGGRYLRKKDGGYILSGKRSDKAVNSDWQEMTSGVEPSASYWLDSPVSTINFTSTGTPSPSAFVVTMKQNIGGNVSDTNRFYLVARKYNGNWLAHVGATLNSQISVPATAGYTQFAVRAYKSASDANAWNNNFVAEKGVGVAKDGAIGATGATGAFPRDRGVWASGQTYVWNADYRDKVIYLIGGVYYNFLVKNYGASVTSAPTSANGDSNWEAMQKFVNIATDTLFADGANVAGFMFKNNVLKSHNDEGETLLINGVTGYFKCKNAEITGTITADKGRIGPFSIDSGMLSSKTLYEGTDSYVGFKLSAGQIEFYNDRTFASVKLGGNTQFVTIEGIKYDAGIDIQSPNAMLGMHIKTPSIPLFVEGGNIFLHPDNDSYVSLRGIVGNWRNISVSTSLNNNDDNVMFINTGNITVTLPPNVPGHTIYFKRMNGGVRLTGGRILPSAGGQEVSYIDLDYASGFIKCMGNYWVMFYCG